MYQDLLEILKKDGLSASNFEGMNQEFFVEGGFRFLIEQAEEISYSLNRFNVKSEDILSAFYNEKEDLNAVDGKYWALCVKFSLQKGSYATMLIREITKLSSDFDF